MREPERLLSLHAATLRWLAVVTAELATPFEADQVQAVLLQASRAARELWGVLHHTLEGQGLAVSASPPPMPRSRRPEAP
jgi:hypothetical protein